MENVINQSSVRLEDIAKNAMRDFGLKPKMLKCDDPTVQVEGSLADWLSGAYKPDDPEKKREMTTAEGLTVCRPVVGDGVMSACVAVSAIYKVPEARVMGYMLRYVLQKQAQALTKKTKTKHRVGPKFHFWPIAENIQVEAVDERPRESEPGDTEHVSITRDESGPAG